jgi:hypothetical protein
LLQKCFSHPSLIISCFGPTLAIKLQLGPIANRWETTNSKPPGPIIYDWLIRKKQGAAVRSHLLHSSLAGVSLGFAGRPICQPQQHSGKTAGWPKIDFADLNRHHHPILISRGYRASQMDIQNLQYG